MCAIVPFESLRGEKKGSSPRFDPVEAAYGCCLFIASDYQTSPAARIKFIFSAPMLPLT